MSIPKNGRNRPVTLLGISHSSITAALAATSNDIKDAFLLSKDRSRRVQIISARLIAGWTCEEAFGFSPPPEQAKKAKARPINSNGKFFPSMQAYATAHGVSLKLLSQRLRRDRWPPEAAVLSEPPPRLPTMRGDITGCIYSWQHIESGKRYVGQTIDPARRRWQHLFEARMGNHAEGTLHGDLKKFGQSAFEFSIIENGIPAPDLPDRERHWIAFLGTKAPTGYNQNRGGVFGGFARAVHIAGTRYEGLRHAAQAYNLHPNCLLGRLQRGWTAEEAVGLEARKPRTRTPLVLDFDPGSEKTEFSSVAAACRHWGYKYRDVESIRSRRGVSWAEAIRFAFIAQLRTEIPEAREDWPWTFRRRRLAGG